jgi:thioredoxin-related protein
VKYERRKWTTWTLVAAGVVTAAGTRGHGVLPASDLHLESLEAERNCKPLLLEFASSSCSYCHLLEAEVLNPTLLNRDYDRRVLMRKLVIDNAARLTDFDGSGQVSAQQLASRYKVNVTPTLLFVDSRGREVAERMVGVTTLEFYGGYLDIALDFSRDTLRAQRRCEN